MDIKKLLEWAPLVVALPLAHLLMSSIFLWAYIHGFGGGIGAFISTVDIFRVSIRHLIYIYVFIAMLAFPMIAQNLGWDFIPTRRLGTRVRIIISATFSVAWLIITFASFDAEQRSWSGGGWLTWVAGSYLFLLTAFPNLSLKHPKIVGIGGFFLTLGLTMAFGASQGFEDRHANFQANAPHVAHCNRVGILRPFSDFYLAIRQDDVELLIDAECHGRFVFPRTWTSHYRLTAL